MKFLAIGCAIWTGLLASATAAAAEPGVPLTFNHLPAARKAADLVCTTYLDAGRRVLDGGDPEMNMAILTGLAMLSRHGRSPVS